MQERKKKTIVIASVLKPVDDTRMFEKIGITLATKHDVHIIGFPSKIPPQHTSIRFYPLPHFSRISFRRFKASYRVFRVWLRIKPQFIIISTHELLMFALLTRLIRETKIIYDIRENYFYNILYTSAFSALVRGSLAYWIRLKEMLAVPFIYHFTLAEKGYGTELSFLPSRKTVLENKFRRSLIKEINKHNSYTKLLFTGTLAETTGIFHVINFAKKLYAKDASVSLVIIGYAAQKETLKKILMEISDSSFIKLIGGKHLVPHSQIIEEIIKADFGLVWYPENKSTATSIPTKFYEYTALSLPILTTGEQAIAQQVIEFQSGVVFNYNDSAENILQKMKSFQPKASVNPNLYWESEEDKLFEIVKDS